MALQINYRTIASFESIPIIEYSLLADYGFRVDFLNYGGIITAIYAEDKHKKFENVVLCHPEFNPANPGHLGAITGRVAGRIANGRFTLKETNYQLEKNNGSHSLHGGSQGLDKRIWQVTIVADGAKLSYLSPAGENGFPANVLFEVYYRISKQNRLSIEHSAYPDQATLINLTNHSYFDLSTGISPMQQTLQIIAKNYAEIDSSGLTTGVISTVKNTPFDFNIPKVIASGLNASHPQLTVGNGYDHPFILDCQAAICLTDPQSGRFLKIVTDEPVCILYTANSFTSPHSGVCLETQKLPNAINIPGFEDSVIYSQDKPYKNTTIWQFGVLCEY